MLLLLHIMAFLKIISPEGSERTVELIDHNTLGRHPDNTVQHAGIIIGIGGIAGHAFLGLARGRSGYLHKASLLQDMSAVTAACLLMKKEVFEQAGGFTEELAVAFNDVVVFRSNLTYLGYLYEEVYS